MNILEVLKVPIEKEKASDETKHVPNLPALLNALCLLLRYNFPGEEDLEAVIIEYEKICEGVANTISAIASQGV